MVVRTTSTAGVAFSSSPGCVATIGAVSSGSCVSYFAKFTSSGTLNISESTVPLNYLVVAGGGGGGSGGGGAGGYRTSGFGPSPLQASSLDISPGAYSIVIGAGGTGTPQSNECRPAGGDSSFYGITSSGGGAGGAVSTKPGGDGGSGGSGGGAGLANPQALCGGAGNTPPQNPPQGNPGGNTPAGIASGGGSGGGGATAAGAGGGPSSAGGAGAPNLITGSDVTYSTGGTVTTGSPVAGGANTGTGGSGTAYPSSQSGGNGGSGIVVVRVPGSTTASVAPGTNSIATLPSPAGGCKVASFTVSGTLTIS